MTTTMIKPEPADSNQTETMENGNNGTSTQVGAGTSNGEREDNGGAGVGTATPAASSTATAAARNAKDPSRPRRKKARRACFACQRAHLTCGDERPCQRCIKRGLQDACHDGVRKKAKYLHDAPIDDGPPEFAPHPTPSSTGSGYPYHPQMSNQQVVATDMRPPDGTINPTKIESPGGMEQQQQQQPFSAAPLFDPSDPALFNFDIASLNFGSHYGALEFGVLGQMSSNNAAHRTTSENGTSNPNSTYGYSPGVGTGDYAGFAAPQDMSDTQWGTVRGSRDEGRGGFANTYMIEAGPGSLTSPSPPIESPRQGYQPVTTAGSNTNYETSGPTISSPNFFTTPPQTTHSQKRPTQPSSLQQVQNASMNANQHLQSQLQQQIQHQQQQAQQQAQQLRRTRPPADPSFIYTTVNSPYPYTLQNHRLFDMLENRFPKPLLLRIARAMASFRPSFIACTQTLNAADLVFMEKCFQRTLWEYERFIQSCGTPTIVCRRTGEVVGVGKEFCMLTGWEKAVLLGEKKNRNSNPAWTKDGRINPLAGTNDPTATSSSNTLLPPPPTELKRPIFLAELLDDESVVEFYEQFARLAFGDSRGAVMTTCTVLTYKEDPSADAGQGRQGVPMQHKVANLAGKDGKVECAFCWTIKRDVFDIPMLIVGNFLPILGKASESG
ncbi:hypothetical protein EX30DRAFT_159162 [Ascodesmis nigricans]|uniref:Zn(2)-C6 fungal-type domain-containing protein n=1 Tax=Ascodesmis nigricans TaxID=341454 RepID=A0A4S2MMZ6_9PEZI|nr:hypothetical protein EX30DRAFT_159162 [Ascodesmis nigricans]